MSKKITIKNNGFSVCDDETSYLEIQKDEYGGIEVDSIGAPKVYVYRYDKNGEKIKTRVYVYEDDGVAHKVNNELAVQNKRLSIGDQIASVAHGVSNITSNLIGSIVSAKILGSLLGINKKPEENFAKTNDITLGAEAKHTELKGSFSGKESLGRLGLKASEILSIFGGS